MAYRILIVDDEPILTELLSTHLQDHGIYMVFCSPASDEALAKLNTKPISFSGHQYAGMDGAGACKSHIGIISSVLSCLTARITGAGLGNGPAGRRERLYHKPFACRNCFGPALRPICAGTNGITSRRRSVTSQGLIYQSLWQKSILERAELSLSRREFDHHRNFCPLTPISS